MKVSMSSGYVTGGDCLFFYAEGRTAWWIGAFRLPRRQARTWRAGHQTSGKGSCVDEGRGAGPQTSHLPPLLPRGLQGMGTSLVPSPKNSVLPTPSHPPILSVRSVYRAWCLLCLALMAYSPTFSPHHLYHLDSRICVFSFLSFFFVVFCDVGFNPASKNIFSISALI